MGTWVIAFYELDRRYGGPEEGGWWYNTGQLVRIFRTVKSEERARLLANRANHILDLVQKRKDIYSMAYSGGRYCAEVYQDKCPEYWPERRPFYE